MSYFLALRTGLPGNHQFSPRSVFSSFEEAAESAEFAFASKQAEYLIEDERGPITYRLTAPHTAHSA
jgi:hypothetical protein